MFHKYYQSLGHAVVCREQNHKIFQFYNNKACFKFYDYYSFIKLIGLILFIQQNRENLVNRGSSDVNTTV